MDSIQQGIIILIKRAITGQKYALPEGFIFEAEEVQKLISKHSIFTIGFEGAVKCGISKDTPMMKQLMVKYLKAMIRSES